MFAFFEEKSVFSPLGASAFGGKKRGKVASILFSAIAEEMIKDKNSCGKAEQQKNWLHGNE